MTVNWMKAQRKAAHTARWAVTMTKVRIRQALARTRWQLVTFCWVSGAESVGRGTQNSSRHVLAFKSRGLCLMIVQQPFQQRVQLD